MPVAEDGSYEMPQQPGDYVGPVTIRSRKGDYRVVWFLKPHARDPGTPARGRSIQHVRVPPHKLIEEDDGSLTIEPSIGGTAGKDRTSDGWHGYLTRGVWTQV